MQPRRPATIYAVADRAGVSIATVSRVLHGTGRTSVGVRERVLSAVDALDYQPQNAAQSLAGRRYRAHGVVVGDIAGPYYTELVMGLESAAAAAGQSVVVQVADHRTDPERALRELAARVDGLVVASSSIPDDLIRALGQDRPVAALGRGPVADADTLATEGRVGARTLTAHLLDHGRVRPVFVGDHVGSYDVSERYAGFRDAAGRLPDLAPEPHRVALTEAAGAAAADELAALVRAGGCDALVCANDELALAIGRELGRSGLVVGHDVALTGWDDVMAARYVTPGLTTVRQPVRQLGAAAAALLLARLDDPSLTSSHHVLAAEPVWRSSCGCPEVTR